MSALRVMQLAGAVMAMCGLGFLLVIDGVPATIVGLVQIAAGVGTFITARQMSRKSRA